jgi:hypothetical protein
MDGREAIEAMFGTVAQSSAMTPQEQIAYECICGHVADDHIDEGSAPCTVDECICVEYHDIGELEP